MQVSASPESMWGVQDAASLVDTLAGGDSIKLWVRSALAQDFGRCRRTRRNARNAAAKIPVDPADFKCLCARFGA